MPLYHIGFHKTATSLLQNNYFKEAHGYHPVDRVSLLSLFVQKFGAGYLTVAEKTALQDSKIAADKAGHVLVLSHERLLGYPSSGAYDRLAILRRLKQASPDAKIMVVIREQKSWLYSMWKQTLIDGDHRSLKAFLQQQHRYDPTRRIPGFNDAVIDYLELHETLVAEFGSANVLMIPFEHLRKSPDSFYAAIQKFSGAQGPTSPPYNEQVNTSKSIFHLLVMRGLHRLVFRTTLSPCGIIPTHGFIGKGVYQLTLRVLRILDYVTILNFRAKTHKAVIARHCDEKFTRQNIELSKRLGRDLSEIWILLMGAGAIL